MRLRRAGAAALLTACLAAVPATAQDEPPSAPLQADRILFRGNRSITFDELSAVAKPYLGRRLQPAEVEELRRRLTRLYVDRGYVNSGARLAPETRDGTLVFQIVEGRLAAVRLHGLDGLDESYVVERLLPVDGGAFNMDALRERFQLLLADPLFARMNGRVSPTGTPGESVLDVDVVRARPYALTVYANDYRPPSIGAEAAGLRGWIRNATGRGDVIEGTVEGPSGPERISRVALGARLPLGARAPFLQLQFDRGRSAVVEEPLASIDIRSVLQTEEIGVGRTFRETLRERWTAGLTRVWRTNETTLLGEPFSFIPGEPDGITRARSWRLWLEIAHRSDVQAATLRTTVSRVRTNISDDGFLAVATADRQYTVWLAQGQYLRRVADADVEVSVRATAQYSNRHTLPLDALPIGGVHTVRGYRENQFIRQNAALLSVQVERAVWRTQESDGRLTLGPFVDYGRGSGGGARPVALSSAGIASRFTWKRFTSSLAVGFKLRHPDLGTSSRRGLQGHGLHLEIAYAVF